MLGLRAEIENRSSFAGLAKSGRRTSFGRARDGGLVELNFERDPALEACFKTNDPHLILRRIEADGRARDQRVAARSNCVREMSGRMRAARNPIRSLRRLPRA